MFALTFQRKNLRFSRQTQIFIQTFVHYSPLLNTTTTMMTSGPNSHPKKTINHFNRETKRLLPTCGKTSVVGFASRGKPSFRSLEFVRFFEKPLIFACTSPTDRKHDFTLFFRGSCPENQRPTSVTPEFHSGRKVDRVNSTDIIEIRTNVFTMGTPLGK